MLDDSYGAVEREQPNSKSTILLARCISNPAYHESNMEITRILRESFFHAGRGPELIQVHYVGNGKVLKAIDYFNPDDEYTDENRKHLLFTKPQVFMFTPEEVYNYPSNFWGGADKAAIVCFGKSAWLRSFSPQHLEKCQHYQVMFYDEFLDVICERIDAIPKAFKEVELHN